MTRKGAPPSCGCDSVSSCTCLERECKYCKTIKPKADFPADQPPGSGRPTRSLKCLDCRRASDRAYGKRNRDKKKAYNRAYYESKAEELKAAQRQRTADNPERVSRANRQRHLDPEYQRWQTDYNLKRNYGISLEDYEVMYAAQGNGCAICFRPDAADKRHVRLHVDHDHETGLVRGLLCSSCNRALGQFGDDPERLERAAQYLRKVAT